ncbi:hypothetical protein, partial [Brevibacillus sp. FIR094]|uniref:hypothetical protein n=1 Tax=Brevibacillus sp. FIR094 TaxID=3134809 RepID=UPI003D1ADA17
MFASKIIGLAALLLVPIFFYIQMAIPKLRSAFILFLAFASAGLAGYSSASSIGIGWTVSLAFLTFLGITVSVIYMSKREDQQIERQFELALKSDHAVFVMPTDKVDFASHSLPGGEECLPAITNTSIEVLAIKQHEAPIPAEVLPAEVLPAEVLPAEVLPA